ncbi:MAG: hypothetical protein EPN47_03360 [Acidobacteria bacterium]|nr:MAG: hypothetical protein EPN47_03360 [Acidobacteriota bacterium]
MADSTLESKRLTPIRTGNGFRLRVPCDWNNHHKPGANIVLSPSSVILSAANGPRSYAKRTAVMLRAMTSQHFSVCYKPQSLWGGKKRCGAGPCVLARHGRDCFLRGRSFNSDIRKARPAERLSAPGAILALIFANFA